MVTTPPIRVWVVVDTSGGVLVVVVVATAGIVVVVVEVVVVVVAIVVEVVDGGDSPLLTVVDVGGVEPDPNVVDGATAVSPEADVVVRSRTVVVEVSSNSSRMMLGGVVAGAAARPAVGGISTAGSMTRFRTCATALQANVRAIAVAASQPIASLLVFIPARSQPLR